MVNWLKYSICFIVLSWCFSFTLTNTWGFYGHKKINRLAVFSVPKDLFYFYKTNIEYVTEHAVDPDKRRYAVEGEAPKHFIDIDHYDTADSTGISRMPHKWKEAKAKFSEDTLLSYGIVPWNIQLVYYNLVNAFEQKDAGKIVKLSADLGHYIADAHVPLHTTENYNGQLSNQKGIHAFWESRLPELFSNDYNFLVGSATYINDPLEYIWSAIEDSHKALDSVLLFEKELTLEFGETQKYSFERRGNQNVKVYSKAFSEAYHEKLNGMVERRMRAAIYCVASFWYSSWVDGGQPEINELMGVGVKEEELRDTIQHNLDPHRGHQH